MLNKNKNLIVLLNKTKSYSVVTNRPHSRKDKTKGSNYYILYTIVHSRDFKPHPQSHEPWLTIHKHIPP